ncbi:hypothetical protein [Streptomyces virginiae]|uniref:hypothetical protein n=1 Tax=Streptomyces virginiae TaxID=1961 RepID=UPI00332C241C
MAAATAQEGRAEHGDDRQESGAGGEGDAVSVSSDAISAPAATEPWGTTVVWPVVRAETTFVAGTGFVADGSGFGAGVSSVTRYSGVQPLGRVGKFAKPEGTFSRPWLFHAKTGLAPLGLLMREK